MLQVVCYCTRGNVLSVVVAELSLPNGNSPVLQALLTVLLPKQLQGDTYATQLLVNVLNLFQFYPLEGVAG